MGDKTMKNFCKSGLVVFLVLALGMLMLPTIALADEASGDLLAEVQADMDAILEDYYIEVGMAEDEIAYVIQTADYSGKANPMDAINALEQKAAGLTEDELAQLQDYESTATFVAFYDVLDQMMTPMAVASSGTYEPVEGVTVGVSGAADDSMSNGAVKVTAKGSAGFWGIGASAKTATITITNSSNTNAELSFDWKATDVNSLSIDGNQYAELDGSFSKMVKAGENFTITITTAKNNTENKLEMSNFNLSAATSFDVTFVFDMSLGSVKVADNTISDGDKVEVSPNGSRIVASANANSKFLCWVDDADNKILSTEDEFTLLATKSENMTIKAVFIDKASESPWFMIGKPEAYHYESTYDLVLFKGTATEFDYYAIKDGYLFDDLNEAAAAAKEHSANKAIVLMNDATLPAGEYTIPAGVTLLIPFDDANTMYTTAAVSTDSYDKPKAYRTLKLANGANLTVNGAMSVSAKHRYAQSAKEGGSPTGAVGFVEMQSGSNITVNDGAALYAYGFVTGSGNVIAKAGASVYENFQFHDFRGGNATTGIKNGVFPLSQYYVQNIEVPLTIYAGAKEYSYTTIYMSNADFGAAVDFIGGSGAMFYLESGYVTKKYDGSKDRLIIDSYGDMSLSSIEMKIGPAGVGVDMDSADYELPINGNITVRVNEGTVNIAQDIAMLPGAEIYIADGAACKLGNGYNVYVYDADEWGDYCGSTNKPFFSVPYAPGQTHTRTVADLKDALIEVAGTMDASEGYLYTTAGGANIYGSSTGVAKIKAGSQEVTYQATQTSNEISDYPKIPITPAKLKNADGTYLLSGTGTYNYYSTKGKWVCENHTPGEEATCTDAQTCTVCGEVVTAANGHTEVVDAAVAPTCSATGLTEGKHCSVCNEVIVKQEVVDALGHTEVIDAAVAADCTKAGKTEGKHCSVCNEVIVKQEVVDALGHTEVVDAAVDATCIATGLTEGKHCSVCNEVLEAQTEVAALGHTEVVDAAVEPTCTETGLTEGKHCSVCNEVLEAQTEVAALGHTEVVDAAVEPTCTETGLTEGKHCSVCNEVLVAQEVVAALGHKAGPDATCTEDQVCTVCGAELKTADGHHEVVDAAVEPNCTETGLTEGKHCLVCNTVLAAQEVVPALGHDEVSHNGKSATCTEVGWDSYVTCSRCDYTTYVEIPAVGHTEVIDAAVAPTCIETGLTQGKHCSVCNEVLE
ncbi:MAG: hypothetical protein IJB55_02170, partial [Firmicutes bacterium]|nr:hypothetical protein [Bacillota bacterium]